MRQVARPPGIVTAMGLSREGETAPDVPDMGKAGNLGRSRLTSSPLAKGICLLVVFGLAWELLVVALGIKPYYVPRLSLILQTVAANPLPYLDGLLRTAGEALAGYAMGTAFGIAMATLFFRAPVLRDMVFPIFVVSQTIPVIAFAALVVMWFGNTLMAKAVIAFYITFFPVTVNTLLGLKSVDPRQVALLRSFGANARQLLFKLQFPSALPHLFVALRLAASLSLVGAIVGEWFGDTTGLGVLLLQAMFNENSLALWAAVLACALLGSAFYAAIAWLERRLVFWKVEH